MLLVQADTQADDAPMALAAINLFMGLGLAVAVSGGQTVFRSRLPGLLAQYVPGVDVDSVLNAGATGVVGLVQPSQLPGLIAAYNSAITAMFVSVKHLFP
jgi:hypothetical protein